MSSASFTWSFLCITMNTFDLSSPLCFSVFPFLVYATFFMSFVFMFAGSSILVSLSCSLQSSAPATNHPSQLNEPLPLKPPALQARLCQSFQSITKFITLFTTVACHNQLCPCCQFRFWSNNSIPAQL